MKNRLTRLLSLALAMTMLVCMMPSLVSSASAAGSIDVLDEPSWYCGIVIVSWKLLTYQQLGSII